MVFYTLNQIINLIEQISLAHAQVNSFGFGEESSISASEQEAYPLVWLNLQPSTITDNTFSLSLSMLVCDIVKADDENERDTLSDCLSIAQDLYAELTSPNYQDYFSIQYNVGISPVREGLPDLVNGFRIDLVLDLEQIRDRCQIPFISGLPGGEPVCSPAVITLNGDSFLVVNSGATTNVTLIDENGDEVTPVSVVGSVIELPPTGGGDATVTLMGDAFLTIPAGDTENILIQDASDSNIEPSSVTGNIIKYNINIKPSFSVAPVLSASGNQNVGTVITCGTGTVLGVPTITYTYQWKRDGVNFVNVGNTYTLLVGDVGTVITCSVTATNGFGSDSELTSNGVTVVAASNYLLDVVSGGRVAYGLIKLRSAYSGNCIRVRRASDNAESNIGFVNDELDVTTLQTFCTGTNGFVTTFYDQTGNGENLVQASASNQLQIVNSGSVITITGMGTGAVARPAMLSTNKFLFRSFTAPIAQPATLTAVHRLVSGDAFGDDWILGYAAPNLRYIAGGFAQQNINNNDPSIQYWKLDGANSTVKRNSSSTATISLGTNSASSLVYGAGASLGGVEYYGQVFVIWDGNKDSSITDIFTILNDYYKTS